jgi:hypothetical protein
MTHHLLLLATLMVLVYGYSRKTAFTNFGRTPKPSAGEKSPSEQAEAPSLGARGARSDD